MTFYEALEWADNWGPLQTNPPSGDGPALLALAAEVRRLSAALRVEREACARVCEDIDARFIGQYVPDHILATAAREIRQRENAELTGPQQREKNHDD
jgi:hypothetical protein